MQADTLTAALFTLKVWPMSVASTVSRLPITVKVVPVSPSEEEGGRGEQQQQSEQDEEGPQQQQSCQQTEEVQTQAGTIKYCSIKMISVRLF